MRYFKNCDIGEIDASKLKIYFTHLKTDYIPVRFNHSMAPLSGSALDNHWKSLRAFFKWSATELGILRPDLELPRPKYELPDIRPFDPSEIKRLLDAAKVADVHPVIRRAYRLKLHNGERDTAIILMLLDTGLRIGEFCRLTVGDVNLEAGEVYVRPYKTSLKSRPRTVFIGITTRKTIWKFIARRQSKTDQNDSLFGVTPNSVRQSLITIGSRANIFDCHPHRFRHTFAINYLRNGGDIFTLQRLLGHSDLAMVQRYLYLAKSDLQAAHRRASPVDNWKL